MTKLKQVRLARKIKAIEVAKRLGITRQSVCIAERKGVRNASAARRYAEVLGCDWRELFDDDAPACTCAVDKK